ncbi:hypothetical protein BpHYR1_042174 [Brachionus plicatilis]|uniref:Uncharacterized protein n=1 Tax=Brachionus plicatilis TaxID=10195 RepID=A0A3M7SF08_BRAPC|nr:hypothetical protein BpHYR1_042174 [Brachionus plicatilis]
MVGIDFHEPAFFDVQMETSDGKMGQIVYVLEASWSALSTNVWLYHAIPKASKASFPTKKTSKL